MDKLIKHLEFLQASSEKTCNYLSDKKINTIPFFCSGLLRRIDDTTTSIKALFELLLPNQKHGFSIGLLFRALILDTLISMYILKFIKDLESQEKTPKETKIEVERLCKVFLSDGLSHALTYIEDAKKLRIRTEEEKIQDFITMGNIFKPFFDNYPNDGTRPKLKFNERFNAIQLFEKLAKNNDFEKASEIYDIYTYLSKYEHFGIVYFHAINEKLDGKLDIFSKAVKAFVGHNAILHWILAQYAENDIFIKEQSRLANDYLLNNVINNNN